MKETVEKEKIPLFATPCSVSVRGVNKAFVRVVGAQSCINKSLRIYRGHLLNFVFQVQLNGTFKQAFQDLF